MKNYPYSHPMALPENSPSNAALIAELADVQRRLEKADENENTIERFFKRDDLLEKYDDLQAEIDATASPDSLPNEKQS